eukprot:GILK01006203.1.p1 GENE.GILK01006203.1~~GILK01006203.1.p1  ORF type:complete len:636 (-),score=153.59 GILK01006203.1:24-1892(-)
MKKKKQNAASGSRKDTKKVHTDLTVLSDIEDIGNDYPKHTIDYHRFTSSEVEDIRRLLLAWYHEHRRKLPWRGDAPPFSQSAALHKKDKASAAAAQATLASHKGSIQTFLKQDDDKKEEGAEEETEAKEEEQEEAGVASAKPVDIAIDAAVQLPVSAYATWVSEVMLQQTRVDTVIDFFVRWMQRWPTVEDLAKATNDEVNHAWQGLGFYRRAKFLHEGAKFVVKEFKGQLPSTVAELSKIPGIGAYTSGAISSIAYRQAVPLVDGNVIRVLSRLRAIAADPKSKEMNRIAWVLAEQLVDPSQPGDFNQAVMELGATVCTPLNPQCDICPVRAQCHAFQEVQMLSQFNKKTAVEHAPTCGICQVDDTIECPTASVTKYPLKAKKKSQREESIAVCVLERYPNGTAKKDTPELLLVRRPSEGLLAGQWECPSVKMEDEDDVDYASRQLAMDNYLRDLLGTQVSCQTRAEIGNIEHVFSHLRHNLMVERIVAKGLSSVEAETDRYRWISADQLHTVGITTGVKKVLALAKSHRAGTSFKGKKRQNDSQPVEDDTDNGVDNENENDHGTDSMAVDPTTTPSTTRTKSQAGKRPTVTSTKKQKSKVSADTKQQVSISSFFLKKTAT